MIIRRATKKDFFALKQLKSEFFLWECEHDSRFDPEWVSRGLGSRLAKNLSQNNTAFFIAYIEKIPIGYCGVEICKNTASFKEKSHGHIFNLYVRKRYRGTGIGKRLFDSAQGYLEKKGIKEQLIMVYEGNAFAKDMYKRQGFREYIRLMNKF